MKWLKKILLSLLGEKKYLSLLANSFQSVYRSGKLGVDYQDVYFLEKIIEPGNTCIDIGAHLGYYTCELSRLVKGSGRVYAIEPMSAFNGILKQLLKKKKISNVVLYQVALGGTGDYVEMGIPQLGNMKKFAYARVMESSAHLEYVASEKVKNESGDALFKHLPELHFIKCDVEGLEVPVFTSMIQTLKKHLPLILCELPDRNERVKLFETLKPLGYEAYLLRDKKLHLLNVYSAVTTVSHNHYFIPLKHARRLKDLIIA